MAYREWSGNAQAVTEVFTITLGGTIAVNDLFNVICSTKTFSYRAGSVTLATERAAFIAAFNSKDSTVYPELSEYIATAGTAAGDIVLTNRQAGRPGVITVSKTSVSGTWTIATTTAATGPNFWNNAGNWVQGSVPVTGDDVYIVNTSVPILYGMNQSGVTLATFRTAGTARNQIGLPKYNSAGYQEYRLTDLQIGATLAEIGAGSVGSGSSLIRLDFGSIQTDLRIQSTASASNDGTPALLWKGTNALNVVTVNGGSVGIGFYPGDTSTVKTLSMNYKSNPADTTLEIGDAVTMTGTGFTLKQSGGIIRSRSGFQDITKTGGDLYMSIGGAVSITNWKGLVRFESPGATIGTLTNAGEFRRVSQVAAATITNQVVLFKDSIFVDQNGSLTLSGGYKFSGCEQKDMREISFGFNRSHTVA